MGKKYSIDKKHQIAACSPSPILFKTRYRQLTNIAHITPNILDFVKSAGINIRIG